MKPILWQTFSFPMCTTALEGWWDQLCLQRKRQINEALVLKPPGVPVSTSIFSKMHYVIFMRCQRINKATDVCLFTRSLEMKPRILWRGMAMRPLGTTSCLPILLSRKLWVACLNVFMSPLFQHQITLC